MKLDKRGWGTTEMIVMTAISSCCVTKLPNGKTSTKSNTIASIINAPKPMLSQFVLFSLIVSLFFSYNAAFLVIVIFLSAHESIGIVNK